MFQIALSLELTDTFYLQVLFKQISCMLQSFCTSFSCKSSIPRSGCSALHGVNPIKQSKELVIILCPTYYMKASELIKTY